MEQGGRSIICAPRESFRFPLVFSFGIRRKIFFGDSQFLSIFSQLARFDWVRQLHFASPRFERKGKAGIFFIQSALI